MISYLLLILATLSFAAQFAFTKIYGERVAQRTVQTLVMILLTGLFGALLYLPIGGFSIRFSPALWWYSLAFAAVMIPYYLFGIQVLSLGSVAIYSMFMMLGGMLLPFAYGLIWLDEPLTWGKSVGCVVLSAAILLQSLVQKQNDTQAQGTRGKRWLFLLLCAAVFVLNGLTGVIAKAYAVSQALPDEIAFTVVSCLLTSLLALFFLIPHAIRRRAETVYEIKTSFAPIPLLCIAAIGAFTHTGNFLHLKAAADLPASVQFPMVSGGVIVCSAMVSLWVFREKVSKKELLCVTLAFLSTLLFAF